MDIVDVCGYSVCMNQHSALNYILYDAEILRFTNLL